MQKAQYPSDAIAADGFATNGNVPSEDHNAHAADERPFTDDVEGAYNDRGDEDATNPNAHHGGGGDATCVARSFDGPALLWTMDEETVLMHSSEASLKRIRTRLENLLLGVSHALQNRKTHGGSPDPFEGRASTSAARPKPRPALDFADAVLAADHAVRRIVGEAFPAFQEDEVVQMVQLCSLADRGVDDCDELVRNAVVVLQALTKDGEAVRDVEHFRQFVSSNGEEIASEQWRHDYVTAIRSLAVGFLREPVVTMSSYGSSINQIVEHEALYVGLLRMCADRPLGNTPHPTELLENLDVPLLNTQRSAQRKMRTQASQQQQQQQQAGSAPTNARTSLNSTHATSFIHTPKSSSKRTHARRPSSGQPALLEPTGDLEHAIGLLLSSASSGPSSPAKVNRSRQASFVGPTPSQLHELQKSTSHHDPNVASEKRASTSCARAEKPKAAYEPVPEVPKRLSLHRGKGPSMSHY